MQYPINGTFKAIRISKASTGTFTFLDSHLDIPEDAVKGTLRKVGSIVADLNRSLPSKLQRYLDSTGTGKYYEVKDPTFGNKLLEFEKKFPHVFQKKIIKAF